MTHPTIDPSEIAARSVRQNQHSLGGAHDDSGASALASKHERAFADEIIDGARVANRTIPVVLAITESLSGVTTWAKRLREELAGHPRYDVRLLHVRHPTDLSGKQPPGYDLCAANIEEARNIIRGLAPAIVVPNYLWQLCLTSCEPNISCLGICHSHSLEEYYLPLAWYEATISHFVAVSPECAARLTERIPFRANDVSVLPYGVHVPPMLTRDYSSDPLRIIYAGRLTQNQKRVGDFVELVDHLQKAQVKFVFDIVGDGDQLLSLQRAMQGFPSADVRFFGRRTYREVEAMWPMHDVFVQTSAFEGTSVSMLEAMAHGVVPVVTSANSGVAGVIKHKRNGFVVPVGDMAKMARSIARLAKKPSLLASLGRLAHQSAQAFSMETYCQRFIKLLDQVASADPDVKRLTCEGGFGGCHPLFVQHQIIRNQQAELALLRSEKLTPTAPQRIWRGLRERISGRRQAPLSAPAQLQRSAA